MKQIMREILVAAIAALCAVATPVLAVQWTWENTGVVTPNVTDITATNTCTGSAGSSSGCEQYLVNVGGQILKVRAYSTSSVQNNTNPPTGNWITANLSNFTGADGGFAVKNRVGGDGNETSPPEHATDNNQVVDILVFELPGNMIWDLDAFRLGWAREDSSNQADVQLWFGGTGLGDDFNFTNVCFTACTTGSTLTGAGPTGLGFTSLGTFENAAQGATISVGGTQADRYLVMAGQLGEQNDHFKLEMLKATGTGGGGQTPVPGTLALLGLGLIGLRSMRRRGASA